MQRYQSPFPRGSLEPYPGIVPRKRAGISGPKAPRRTSGLGQHRIDPARASDIQVAVGEAVNNVIEHAYGAAAGPMHLSGWFDGSTLAVEIRDHGRWRPEREERRGHGVKIMRALADRVDLNTTPTGTVVRLALAAAPPPNGAGLSSG